jgi:hypothetical protein
MRDQRSPHAYIRQPRTSASRQTNYIASRVLRLLHLGTISLSLFYRILPTTETLAGEVPALPLRTICFATLFLAGNVKTAAFIPFWSDGKDSFKSNPPNADVSILEGNKLNQVVVELQDPELNGENLTYTVKVLGGEMPATGADISVFIDIIGRPLTPFSYAGVARRTYRRAYYYR